MDDAQLKSLTVKELLELQAEVELAIRAAIRAKREKKPAVAPAPKRSISSASATRGCRRENSSWRRRQVSCFHR